MKNEKSVAAAFSIIFHIVVFSALAFLGLFAFLQQRETIPVDVAVYDNDAWEDTSSETDDDSSGQAQAMGNDGISDFTVTIPASQLPAISETYTQAVAQEREIKQLITETGMDKKTATEKVATKYEAMQAGTNGKAGSDPASNGPGKGDGPGSGSGTGSGHGDGSGSGDGAGQGEGSGSNHLQPAKRAVLISQPDTSSYYPQDLRQKGISGTVSVHVTISAEGAVIGAYVSGSSGYGSMDAAAEQVAQLCQYQPAVNEYGQAVSSSRTMNVPFYLH